MKFLLERGADVNLATKSGQFRTSLSAACMAGNIAAVRILVEAGADLELGRLDNGSTPLLTVAGFPEGLEFLLAQGARPDAVNSDGCTAMHFAALGGATESVALLLQADVDIDTVDKRGYSPLGWAADAGHVQMIDFLIESGSKTVNLPDLGGFTPVCLAALRGFESAVRSLVEGGADVNIPTHKGSPPLYFAATRGHVECCKELLKSGARVDLANSSGVTPLKMAAQEGHLEVVRVLLQTGASADLGDGGGWTPLHVSVNRKHLEVVRLLASCCNVDQRAQNGTPALFIAVKAGTLEIVEVLAERADLCLRALDGGTVLSTSMEMGHFDIAELLLKRGLRCVDQAKEGASLPMCLAAERGMQDLVRLMLDAGAAVDWQGRRGVTPLTTACRAGHLPIVKLLCERGALVQPPKGIDPLVIAAINGRIDVVQYLVGLPGTDVDRRDENGETAMQRAAQSEFAEESECVEVVKFLISKGAKVENLSSHALTPLLSAAMNGRGAVVRALLECGANGLEELRSGGRAGWRQSALCLAAAKGHLIVVDALLEWACADDARLQFFRTLTLNNMSPLTRAAEGGFLDVVVRLEAIFDRFAPNALGWTPLHYAAKGGHLGVLEHLLEAGAPIDAEEKDGATPLFLTALNDKDEACALLLKHGANANHVTCTRHSNPLLIALSKGNFKVALLLLSHPDIDVNLRDESGLSPLMAAAEAAAPVEVLEAVLRAGARLDERRADGSTLLSNAVRKQNLEMVRFVLEVGPAVDMKQGGADSELLAIAAGKGAVEIAVLLLDHGADPDALNKGGRTPLMLATTAMHTKIVELLLKCGADSALEKDGQTALQMACLKRPIEALVAPEGIMASKLELVQLLSQNAPDAEVLATLQLARDLKLGPVVQYLESLSAVIGDGSRSEFGVMASNSQALMRAVKASCSAEEARTLLEAGARCDFLCSGGSTAFYAACQGGRADIVELFLQTESSGGAEAISMVRQRDGSSPLFIASFHGHASVVALLLARDADVERPESSTGATPIFVAAQNGHLDVVRLLVEEGHAAVNEPISSGATAMNAAAKHTSIVEYLLAHGAERRKADVATLIVADVSGSLMALTSMSDTKTVESEARREGASTTLLRAALLGDLRQLKMHITDLGSDLAQVNENGETALHLAARTGHREAVDMLLRALAASSSSSSSDDEHLLHSTDNRGRTPLMSAAVASAAEESALMSAAAASASDYVGTISLLLGAGARVTQTDGDGLTPLALAALSGAADVVALLATADARGAASRVRVGADHAPLLLAVRGGHAKCVAALLKARDTGHRRDGDSEALELAAREGHAECLDVLLEFASADTEGSGGGDSAAEALFVAAVAGHLRATEVLVRRGARLEARDDCGATSLLAAVRNGHGDIASMLIAAGADVTAVDQRGWTALRAAASRGAVGEVRSLLAAGARDKLALHAACGAQGQLPLVELLLQADGAGGSTSSTDEQGATPLHAASSIGHSEIVRLLLAKGANPDATDGSGATSLHRAAQYGDADVVRILLDAGGKDGIDSVGGGATPLFVALHGGHSEVVETLLEYGAGLAAGERGFKALHLACESGHPAVLDVLIASLRNQGCLEGAIDERATKSNDDDSDNDEGCSWTPLAIACAAGHVLLVERLLGAKASPNLAIGNGMTPLHLSSDRGFTEIVSLLLSHGASCQVKNTTGVTPLHLACCSGHLEVVKILFTSSSSSFSSSYSSLIEAVDSAGFTPLHSAASHGRLPVVDFLIEQNADHTILDLTGRTALHLACENMHVLCARRLLDLGVLENWTVGSTTSTPFLSHCFSCKWYGLCAELMRRGKGADCPEVAAALADEARRASPCRVMVLGSPAAGKSSLIRLLQIHADQEAAASFPDENVATDGVGIQSLQDFVFWDFGGQEVLHSTHEFFLSEGTQFVVVADVTRLLNDGDDGRAARDKLKHWLGVVRRFSDMFTPPCIVVSTHWDAFLGPKKFGYIRNHFRSRKEEGASRHLAALVQELEPGLRNPLFFRIWRHATGRVPLDGSLPLGDIMGSIRKHAVEITQKRHGFSESAEINNMKALKFEHTALRLLVAEKAAAGVKFVWWADYLAMCEAVGIDTRRSGDDNPVSVPTAFLVQFGAIVTHKQYSTAAPDLVVLDPRWLTSAFTSIISIKLVSSEERAGFLRRERLESNWRSLEIPEESWPQLLNLFTLFQLVVSLPDGRYFVPSLMRAPQDHAPKMTSTERDRFLMSRRVQYARRFDILPLPPGLIDRLVVRLLHFPGVGLMHASSCVDDYVLSSPFGLVRVQRLPGLECVVLGMYVHEDDTDSFSAELGFFVHFLFESPRALLASYFVESSICAVEVIKDGASVGTESQLQSKALCGGSVMEAPDLALPEVERLNPDCMEVTKKLDEGTFGIVSLANYSESGAAVGRKMVVVKQLKNADKSEKSRREFFREVLCMKRFEGSDFLVRLLGICPNPADRTAAMLMVLEFAPLGDLTKCHDRIRKSASPMRLKLKLAFDLARGLRDLHHSDGLQLMHRDVRSQNFFIFSLNEFKTQIDDDEDSSKRYIHGKLGDFGTVVVASPNYGEALGNFQYMAPEAFQGALAVPYSPAIDVYSFGILMWEIFSCQIPYQKYILNAGVGRGRILEGERPPISVGLTGEDVAALIQKCWNGNPNLRPSFFEIVDTIVSIGNKIF